MDEATSPEPRETPGLVASSTTGNCELSTKFNDEPPEGGSPTERNFKPLAKTFWFGFSLSARLPAHFAGRGRACAVVPHYANQQTSETLSI